MRAILTQPLPTVAAVRYGHCVHLFGAPEAIWKLKVVSFPAVVTIDANGGSLHKDVEAASSAKLAEIQGKQKK